MKKLVAEKLPCLNEHLQINGIDVTIVTFKWFLTLFVDGLPTEVGITLNPFRGISKILFLLCKVCIKSHGLFPV